MGQLDGNASLASSFAMTGIVNEIASLQAGRGTSRLVEAMTEIVRGIASLRYFIRNDSSVYVLWYIPTCLGGLLRACVKLYASFYAKQSERKPN